MGKSRLTIGATGWDYYIKETYAGDRVFTLQAARKYDLNELQDQIACNDISSDYFAYKFNMTKRLEEIRSKQEELRRHYVVPRRMRRWL